jgi:hypothetical protein
MRCSRPDIPFQVGKLFRSVAKWTKKQDRELLRLMRYIWCSRSYELVWKFDLTCTQKVYLELYTDADLAGADSKHSTGGWILVLRNKSGTTFAVLDWGSKLIKIICNSTAETEMSAVNFGMLRSLHPTRMLLEDLEVELDEDVIQVDNQAVIAAVKNVRTTVVRTMRRTHGVNLMAVNTGTNSGRQLQWCESSRNLADIQTKDLAVDGFERLRDWIGMKSLTGIEV